MSLNALHTLSLSESSPRYGEASAAHTLRLKMQDGTGLSAARSNE